MGRKKLDINEDIINSAYSNIKSFKDIVKHQRAQEAFENNEYETFEDALAHMKDPSVLPEVRKIVMTENNTDVQNDKKVMSVVSKIGFRKIVQNEETEILIKAFKYIISNVMQISPAEFNSIYSTETLKKNGLYPTVQKIIDAAPIDTKIDCAFDNKTILFKMVWNDTFSFLKPSSLELFYTENNVKQSLKKAAGIKSVINNGYEEKITEMLLNIIKDVIFDEMHLQTTREIFEFLTEESSKFFDKDKEETCAGICEIIDELGYPSLLDFYFFNLPKERQIENIIEYKYFRGISLIPENKLITAGINHQMEELPGKNMIKEKDYLSYIMMGEADELEEMEEVM